MKTRITIAEHEHNWLDGQNWLQSDPNDGAVVTFSGKVRSFGEDPIGLYIEYYPGMTESVLMRIATKARAQWRVNKIIIFHRVGDIELNDTIVVVGVSSAHRAESFAAAEYIMDVLKTEAPFWKKEKTRESAKWVEAKFSDGQALKKWNL